MQEKIEFDLEENFIQNLLSNIDSDENFFETFNVFLKPQK